MRRLIKQKSYAGFTLIEALVVTAILFFALEIFYAIYLSGLEIRETTLCQNELQSQARIGLKFMVSELRNATRTSMQNPSPNLSIPSTPNNTDIQFYLPEDKDNDGLITDENGDIEWATNNPIQYQYIAGLEVLRRLEKGVQKILAHDVNEVQFIDIDIDPILSINELKIILTLNKTTSRGRDISVTLSAIVALRN